MPDFDTQAIVLRAVDYNDNDRIVTLLTRRYGKVPVIAKGAKKSMKRFGGALGLFSLIDVVWSTGRSGKGLPFLKEATNLASFERIRTDIISTAYASYWSELTDRWLEEGDRQDSIFNLLNYALARMNEGDIATELLSIFFQMKFLAVCGFTPNLEYCSLCRKPVTAFAGKQVNFIRKKGGIVCRQCLSGMRDMKIHKGTARQLAWLLKSSRDKAFRIRFPSGSEAEGNRLIEAFVSYCLGSNCRSLKFLRDLRAAALRKEK